MGKKSKKTKHSNQVQLSSMMLMISSQDYNTLIQENTRLRQRIAELEGNTLQMNIDIMNKNREIDVLRRENEELRNRIKVLEENINDLKKKNDDLMKNVNELKDWKKKKETKEILEKIIVAIQDLNYNEKLERTLK